MSVFYDNKRLLTTAKQIRMVLPGDTEMAQYMHLDHDLDAYRTVHLDTAVTNLVRTLGEKGWEVPHINAHFSVIEDDDYPIHVLNYLEGTKPGEKWAINFGRLEYFDGRHTVPSKPSHMVIPGHELILHDDGAGDYFRYVGNNWDEDEDDFHYCHKPDNKNNRTKLLYLCYHRTKSEYRNYVHTNVGGKEGNRTKTDAKAYGVMGIHARIAGFFNGVTRKLGTHPDHPQGPYSAWMEHARTEATPLTFPLPSFYVTRRMPRDPADTAIVLPTDDGVPLYTGGYNRNIPAAAREQAHFGFPGIPWSGMLNEFILDPTSPTTQIIKVTLKYADNISVIDETVADERRKEFMSELSQKGRLNLRDSEQQEILLDTVQTMTPLRDYKDNFRNPVIVVRRPLGPDEAVDITEQARQRKKGGKGLVLRPEAFQ